jgi:hypothetical protein
MSSKQTAELRIWISMVTPGGLHPLLFPQQLREQSKLQAWEK